MKKLEKPVAIKPDTHGGARAGSGRKPSVATDAERKQDEALATWEPSIDRPPAYRPDLLMLGLSRPPIICKN